MAAINSSRSRFEVSGTSANLASGGTVTSSGTTLTGTSTAFETDLLPGDVIHEAGTADFLIVDSIASDTSLVVHQAPTNAMSGATVNKFPFTQVPAAFDASGPSPEAEEYDVTTWDTLGFREKIQGLIDAGRFECTLRFQPKQAAQKALIDDFYNQVRHAYRMWYFDSVAGTAPPHKSNSRWSFVGDILNFSTSASEGSAVEANFAVGITGKPVIVEGDDT